MAVYIKGGISRTLGQEMPDNCLYDCRLVNSCMTVPRWASKEVLDELKVKRHKNCPLVEVKEPHGRLIDADALKQTLIPMRNCNSDSDFANKCVWHALEDAPTVIERSEE